MKIIFQVLVPRHKLQYGNYTPDGSESCGAMLSDWLACSPVTPVTQKKPAAPGRFGSSPSQAEVYLYSPLPLLFSLSLLSSLLTCFYSFLLLFF